MRFQILQSEQKLSNLAFLEWNRLCTIWDIASGTEGKCESLVCFLCRITVPIYNLGLLILKTDRKKKLGEIELQKCLCPICKHEVTNVCVKQKCPCCIDMKDNSVIGHSVE